MVLEVTHQTAVRDVPGSIPVSGICFVVVVSKLIYCHFFCYFNSFSIHTKQTAKCVIDYKNGYQYTDIATLMQIF